MSSACEALLVDYELGRLPCAPGNARRMIIITQCYDRLTTRTGSWDRCFFKLDYRHSPHLALRGYQYTYSQYPRPKLQFLDRYMEFVVILFVTENSSRY